MKELSYCNEIIQLEAVPPSEHTLLRSLCLKVASIIDL